METKYLERATLYHPGQLTISDQISALSEAFTALIFRSQLNIYLMALNSPALKALSAKRHQCDGKSFMRSEFMQFKRLITGKATPTKIERTLMTGFGVYALIVGSSFLFFDSF